MFQVYGKVKETFGSPRKDIIRVADEEGATMIVTGTRCLGEARRKLLGSVSEYLIHNSNIPVVVCRHEGHEQYERRRQQQLERYLRSKRTKKRLSTA